MEKETKKYKTAAALRRVMEERLAAEKLNLAALEADRRIINARIVVIMDLLETPAANGNEEDENA